MTRIGDFLLEKIYGLADIAAAAALLFGGVSAPAALLYACSFVLVLKGMLSFVPIPLYMPSLLMCGTDILTAGLLVFSAAAAPIKIFLIFILLFKSVPGLIFSLLGK